MLSCRSITAAKFICRRLFVVAVQIGCICNLECKAVVRSQPQNLYVNVTRHPSCGSIKLSCDHSRKLFWAPYTRRTHFGHLVTYDVCTSTGGHKQFGHPTPAAHILGTFVTHDVYKHWRPQTLWAPYTRRTHFGHPSNSTPQPLVFVHLAGNI